MESGRSCKAMNGWSAGGGSTWVTSKPAPLRWPASSAGPTADSSTRPPRAVLMSRGLRFIAASSVVLIM